jgi:hypothetical protein
MAAQTSADLHITVDSDEQLEAQLAETGLKGALVTTAEGPGGQWCDIAEAESAAQL